MNILTRTPIDTATGEITLTDFNPTNDIAFPSGATHLILTSAFAKINFETGENSIEISLPINLAIHNTTATQTLVPQLFQLAQEMILC